MFNLIPWKRRHDDSGSAGSLAPTSLERSLAQIRSDFDSLLSRFWDNWAIGGDRWFQNGLGWSFSMDESEDAYVLRAEAPGFEAEDFQVDVRGNYLSIRAEHKEEQRDGERGSRYRYGQFQRTMPLPPGINSENISARYHSGVLEVRVPKRPEARGKRITVQAA
jgi:HSP20 family protein